MATGQQVKDNGWRQGSFLPSDMTSSLAAAHDCEDATHAVLISQDCDVTHPDLQAEPFVEILFLQAVEATNPGLTDGKSSRFLHLAVSTTSISQALSALAWNKARIDREMLAEAFPDAGIIIPPGTLKGMIRWVADRYTRTGFPDAFVERTKSIEKPLIKLMKSEGVAFWQILVDLDSFGELPAEKDYEMSCVCVVHPETWENPAAQKQACEAADKLKALIAKCQGIQLEEFEVNTSDEIPLSYLHKYHSWDVFNYLTHRDLLKED